MTPRPKHTREPVQAYLDPDDRALLLELAARTGLPQAELLRRGLRRLAADLAEHPPGASLDQLIGALASGQEVPKDLAIGHDDYLYGSEAWDEPRGD